jgi:surface carbohydrate biosynthesis protein (TIGR04326 family)
MLFVGHDRDVSIVLKGLCATRNIAYSWRQITVARAWSTINLKGLVGSLPHLMQGLIALVYLATTRWVLRRGGAPPVADEGRRILICAPFFNLATDESGEFASRFWTKLPRVLLEAGFQVFWLHLFYAHEQLPSPRAAKHKVDSLNKAWRRNGAHSLVDGYLTLGGLLRVLRQWLTIALESTFIGWVLRRQFSSAVRPSLWPLIRHDWAKAFRGIGCVENLFYAECFDRALTALPRQDEGIYLMENQGWERALARAWCAHGHGRLTGVAHSSIRFWDLRYHCDSRRYEADRNSWLPGPDAVVLNGRAMEREYLATQATREPTVRCEALRYLHLVPRERCVAAPKATGPARILVLGDYLPRDADAVLRFLERCRESFVVAIEIWVKSHPNAPLDPLDYPTLALKVCFDSVSELAPQVHLALASKSTTAALDAYVSGCRVVVYDEGSSINYSPVRGLEGVSFVRDPAELQRVVAAALDGSDGGHAFERDLLTIDPALPRWKRYFGVRTTTPVRGHADLEDHKL